MSDRSKVAGLWDETYRHIIPNMMRRLRWRRWEMPRAMQRTMQSTPILSEIVSSRYNRLCYLPAQKHLRACM